MLLYNNMHRHGIAKGKLMKLSTIDVFITKHIGGEPDRCIVLAQLRPESNNSYNGNMQRVRIM